MMWELIAGSIAIEFFEVYWRRSSTLMGSLAKDYHLYQKSVFIFLFMHFGFLYTIFVALLTDVLNWAIVLIFLFKILDIFTKIYFIQELFVKQRRDKQMISMLEMPTPEWYYMINVILYPYLLYLGLSVAY